MKWILSVILAAPLFGSVMASAQANSSGASTGQAGAERTLGLTTAGVPVASACAVNPAPTWCSGSDVGAWVNACIKQFFPSPNNPGICSVAPGTYILSSPIVKPQWVTLDFNNAVVTVKSLSGPAIITANTASLIPSYPGTYSRRGIRNLTLIGSGPDRTPYGVWLGGDPSGKFIDASASDFLEDFEDVHVQNFGTQLQVGNNTFQDSWIGGTIMGGYPSGENGVGCAEHITGAENMSFVGAHFISGGGNTGFAVLCPDAGNSTFSFDDLSFDYWGANNQHGCPDKIGGGQISFNGGHLILNAVHLESCSGPAVVSTNSSLETIITIGGGTEITLADTKHTLITPGLIEVSGGAPQVYIEPGTLLNIGKTQTVNAYIANSGSGGQFFCGPYLSVKGAGYNQIPCRTGPWNAGFETMYRNGSISGFNIVGNFSTSGNASVGTLSQPAASNFAGKCAMQGRTCSFNTKVNFTNYLSFVSIDASSNPPSSSISATCSLSGNVVTIRASQENSLLWDCMIVGNPD